MAARIPRLCPRPHANAWDMQANVILRLKATGVACVLPRSVLKSWYAAKTVDALADTTSAQLTAYLAR